MAPRFYEYDAQHPHDSELRLRHLAFLRAQDLGRVLSTHVAPTTAADWAGALWPVLPVVLLGLGLGIAGYGWPVFAATAFAVVVAVVLLGLPARPGPSASSCVSTAWCCACAPRPCGPR